MDYTLTKNKPLPLRAVQVGATGDARWRGVRARVRVINRLDVREDPAHPTRPLRTV